MKNRVTACLLGIIVLAGSVPVAASVTYTYDVLQRLTGVVYDNGSSLAYTYDAAGNRLTVVSKAALSTVVANGGGTVTGAGLYAPGAKVSLTAKPAPGNTFLRWEDGSQVATRSLLITDASVILTAYFGPTASIASPAVANPGPQSAMVGVAFRLPLQVTSDSLPMVTMAGLPAGLKYDDATKSITGVPTAAISNKAVTVAAKNVNKTATTQTFTMTVDPLPLWAWGTFNGWCLAGSNHVGVATMTVTVQGKVTGKLSAGGTSYAFSAAAYAAGSDPAVGFSFVTNAAAGKAVLPLELQVSQPAYSGGADFAPQFLGLADGWLDEGGPDAASLLLYRNIWKDPGMTTALAPCYTGYYTATLPLMTDLDNASDVCGSGYLGFTLETGGSVKTAGKLADGTAVSLSGPLILDETGRVFTVIYTSPAEYNGGCLFGLVGFVNPDAGGPVFLSPFDNVPFIWENRNPQATSVYADLGFVRELGLIGGWYDKTGNLYDYYSTKVLTAGTDAGAHIPELIVGGNPYGSVCWNTANIELKPVCNSLGIMTGLYAPEANLPVKVNGVWGYSAANTVGLTAGLTRATGIFKGSFKAWFDYDTTHTSMSISYEGVLTPEREDPTDGIEGRGFFLWADKGQYLDSKNKPVTYPFNWSYDFLINE